MASLARSKQLALPTLLVLALGGCDALDGGADGVDGGVDLPPLGDGVATLAGGSEPGTSDGPRGVGQFDNPANLTVAHDGNVYVADFDNSLIRAVSPTGETWTVEIGNEAFWRPFGIEAANDGSLWVQTDGDLAGDKNGALWRVDVNGGATLVVDGVGRARGLAALPDGRLAMSDFLADVISIYDPSSGNVELLAGGLNTEGFNDGVGASARFNRPYGMAVLPDGDLVVTDLRNDRLRRVSLDGVVTTYAGSGRAGGDDGELLEATFNDPIDVVVADSGVLYVSDAGGYRLRKIENGIVSTLAGTGDAGWHDSSDPMQAQFFGMEGLDTDGGYLYVADGNRGQGDPFHRIRRVTID